MTVGKEMFLDVDGKQVEMEMVDDSTSPTRAIANILLASSSVTPDFHDMLRGNCFRGISSSAVLSDTVGAAAAAG